MTAHLYRSIDQPIRKGLSWDDMWRGADRGLIYCWERGRQKREKEPNLAARADKGELVMLVWKGGVDEKHSIDKKSGTLQYLATWQGLRGEDLEIALEDKRVLVCSKTGQAVVFSAKLPVEEE